MAPALALPRVLFDQQCRFWHQRHPAPRHRDTRAKPKQLLSPYRKYHYCRIKGQVPFFYRDNFLPPCRVSSPAKERQYQGTAGCPIEAQEEKKPTLVCRHFVPGRLLRRGLPPDPIRTSSDSFLPEAGSSSLLASHKVAC